MQNKGIHSDPKSLAAFGPVDAQRWASNNIGDNLKSIRWITFIILLMFSFATNAASAGSGLVSQEQIKDLKKKQGTIFKQPNGPFAVMLFNEFALGANIGIIYYKQMGQPTRGEWWISNRFWQSKPWSECITSFAWSTNGKHLYIGTSEVYGDGGSFKIDLLNKSHTRLYPKKEQGLEGVSSTEIIKIDTSNNQALVRVVSADYKTTKTIGVTID